MSLKDLLLCLLEYGCQSASRRLNAFLTLSFGHHAIPFSNIYLLWFCVLSNFTVYHCLYPLEYNKQVKKICLWVHDFWMISERFPGSRFQPRPLVSPRQLRCFCCTLLFNNCRRGIPLLLDWTVAHSQSLTHKELSCNPFNWHPGLRVFLSH